MFLFFNQTQSRIVFLTNHKADRVLYNAYSPYLQILFAIKHLERYLVNKSSQNNNIPHSVFIANIFTAGSNEIKSANQHI